VPKDTPMAKRRQLSDLFAALNAEPEMKELAAKSGFELINVPVEQMESYMKERAKVYGESAKRLGIGEKK
jgi:tripartite-type tricarboxylate transporter receptor subunit TctC